MHYAFQDKEYIYLIMDYLGGGDLRYHIIKNNKFNESKTSKTKHINILQNPNKIH
jgi:serine/threonine protein kinase